MQKIPTIFERDWEGDRSRVVDVPSPHCAWVFAGEGVATRKLDGTSCAIINGTLYKRREFKADLTEDGRSLNYRTEDYPDFIPAGADLKTRKVFGWMPVGDGPEDKWHREAFDRHSAWLDGTYELLGPKVQGGAEKDCYTLDYGDVTDKHVLMPHRDNEFLAIKTPFDRTFDGIKAFLTGKDIEGIVFHHPDGRMGKIKLRDFGLRRGVSDG